MKFIRIIFDLEPVTDANAGRVLEQRANDFAEACRQRECPVGALSCPFLLLYHSCGNDHGFCNRVQPKHWLKVLEVK